jgi:hypothetical protein
MNMSADLLADATQQTYLDSSATVRAEIRRDSSRIILRGCATQVKDLQAEYEKVDQLFPLVKDESRNSLSTELFTRLNKLNRKNLAGQKNGFLLLGHKGVGKTKFLKSCLLANYLASDKMVVNVYICLKNNRDLTNVNTLFSTIFKKSHPELPLPVVDPGMADMDRWWNWMLDNQLRLFLILDEFEFLYSLPDESKFIGDISNIGERSGDRAILSIVSGSSAYLRALTFRKFLPPEVVTKYPTYSVGTPDLNHSKFLPHTIRPIQTLEGFAEACKAIVRSFPSVATVHPCRFLQIAATGDAPMQVNVLSEKDEFRQAFFAVRGNLRSLEDMLRNGRSLEQGDFPVRFEDSAVQQVLYTLFTASARVLEADNLPVESWPFHTKPVPESEFTRGMGGKSLLFDMSDKSVIHYDDGKHLVEFVHPSDVAYCMKWRVPNDLTWLEQYSLLHPEKTEMCAVNEMLVAESLSQLVDGIQFGSLTFRVKTDETLSHVLTEPKDVGYSAFMDPRFQGSFDASENCMPAVIAKELPGGTGSDLCAVFATPQAAELRVLRVQVKVGNDPLTPKAVQDFMELLTKGSVTISAMYPDKTLKFFNVLWLVRPRAPTPRTPYPSHSDNDNMLVWYRTDLMGRWVARAKKFLSTKTHFLVEKGYSDVQSPPATQLCNTGRRRKKSPKQKSQGSSSASK